MKPFHESNLNDDLYFDITRQEILKLLESKEFKERIKIKVPTPLDVGLRIDFGNFIQFQSRQNVMFLSKETLKKDKNNRTNANRKFEKDDEKKRRKIEDEYLL